jgi:hypothetical protein
MKSKIKTKEETLRGHAVATEWDKSDNVIEVSIQTEDNDYRVDDSNALGRELLDSLDQEIEVTGIVRQDRHGANIITVMDFETLGEEEDGSRFDDDWKPDFEDENGETPY